MYCHVGFVNKLTKSEFLKIGLKSENIFTCSAGDDERRVVGGWGGVSSLSATRKLEPI